MIILVTENREINLLVIENNENNYYVSSNSYLINYNELYKEKFLGFVNIKFANLIVEKAS